MKRVSAVVTIKRRGTCKVTSGAAKGRYRSCTKTLKRAAKVKRSGKTYVVLLTKFKAGDKASVRFSAVSLSGSGSALTISLKLRPKKA